MNSFVARQSVFFIPLPFFSLSFTFYYFFSFFILLRAFIDVQKIVSVTTAGKQRDAAVASLTRGDGRIPKEMPSTLRQVGHDVGEPLAVSIVAIPCIPVFPPREIS